MTKVIALGAGHGYNTAGKRCIEELDPNQTREWFMSDRIADEVERDLTTNYDCKVIRLDDTTGKKDISLSKRVAAANKAKAIVCIEIHHDAGKYGNPGGGTTVFYYPTGDCKVVATKLYRDIINRTGLVGDRATPVRDGSHLYMIKKTAMPCFLIENGFMDSPDDVPVILTKAHAERTAKGIVTFLVEQYCLEQKKTCAETPSVLYYPACDKRYTTLAIALSSIGVNSSFAYRKKIAAANNITGYCGTATQNTQMLNLLRAGLLKKV